MSYQGPRAVVAEEIRAALYGQHKTGAELAALLNMSQMTASRRINGKVDIRLDDLKKIADWLQLDFAALVNTLADAA